MKFKIAMTLLILAGVPLFLAETTEIIHPNQIEKISMIAACLTAIVFLWYELKDSRKEFTDHIKETEKKRDELTEKRLIADDKLSNALDSLTDATEKSIATSDRSAKMIEELRHALANKISSL
jgi:septal ring factor EnvC (AmiA/AmiB activator)